MYWHALSFFGVPGVLALFDIYFMRYAQGSFIMLGVFILFATPRGSLLCSGICFMCCAQGSSLHLGHLFYLICVGTLECVQGIYLICCVRGFFTALETFILFALSRGFSPRQDIYFICRTQGHSPRSEYLFYLLHSWPFHYWLGNLFHVLHQRALYRTWGIYFTCYARGLFTKLKAFILPSCGLVPSIYDFWRSYGIDLSSYGRVPYIDLCWFNGELGGLLNTMWGVPIMRKSFE